MTRSKEQLFLPGVWSQHGSLEDESYHGVCAGPTDGHYSVFACSEPQLPLAPSGMASAMWMELL